jgi:hypothetical protein
MEKILFLLGDKSFVRWEDVFADERKRRGIIACFLAMLELTKLQKIFIRQENNFSKIVIYRKEAAADEPTQEAPVPESGADAGSSGDAGVAGQPGVGGAADADPVSGS